MSNYSICIQLICWCIYLQVNIDTTQDISSRSITILLILLDRTNPLYPYRRNSFTSHLTLDFRVILNWSVPVVPSPLSSTSSDHDFPTNLTNFFKFVSLIRPFTRFTPTSLSDPSLTGLKHPVLFPKTGMRHSSSSYGNFTIFVPLFSSSYLSWK